MAENQGQKYYESEKKLKPKIQKPIKISPLPSEKIQQVQDACPTTAPVVTDPGSVINAGEIITILWTSVPGVTWYDYQFEPDPTFTNADTKGTNTISMTRYTDGNITTRTTYYFRVRARNNNGSGPWSNVVDIIILPVVAQPIAPTIPPVISTSNSTILSNQTYTISWSTPPNADLYYLQESGSQEFNPSSPGSYGVSTPRNQANFHHEVTQPVVYYYRVKAANAELNKWTNWSNTISVTVGS